MPWGTRASGPSPRLLAKQRASRSCARPIGTARYSPPAVCVGESERVLLDGPGNGVSANPDHL